MRKKEAVTFVVCTVIVLAAYATWYGATQSFNPIPATVTLDTSASCLPSSPPCPAFGIDSANLTVRTAQDIVSQELTLTLTAAGPSSVSRLSVFFAGVPIGNFTKTLVPGQSATGTWAIPTTINVTVGNAYAISVRAQYVDSSSGEPVAQYWASTQAVAE